MKLLPLIVVLLTLFSACDSNKSTSTKAKAPSLRTEEGFFAKLKEYGIPVFEKCVFERIEASPPKYTAHFTVSGGEPKENFEQFNKQYQELYESTLKSSGWQDLSSYYDGNMFSFALKGKGVNLSITNPKYFALIPDKKRHQQTCVISISN